MLYGRYVSRRHRRSLSAESVSNEEKEFGLGCWRFCVDDPEGASVEGENLELEA